MGLLKKLILSIFIVCQCLLATHSQPSSAHKDKWETYAAHGYFGYRDAMTREVTLLPQYYLARPFAADGWARVLHRDRWHFIDRAGNVMLETEYLQCCFSVSDFDHHGYALISSGQDKWFINRQGERAIAANFVDAQPFQTHVLAHGRTIDLAIVAVAVEPSKTSSVSRLYGAINRQGQFHIPARYVRFGDFSVHGIASVTHPQANGLKPQFTQEFIDTHGRPVGELVRRCGQHVLVNASGKQQLPKTIERDCAGWLPSGLNTTATN